MPQEAETISFRMRILDADGKLVGRKPAEHHGVDGADARAGQHGDQRFRDHRHVDDDAVALPNAHLLQDAAECRDFVQHLGVGVNLLLAGYGAIVDDGRLHTAPALHMPVEAVVAGVRHPAREPAAVNALGSVEDALRLLDPVDVARRVGPEPFRVAFPACVNFRVMARAKSLFAHGQRPPNARILSKSERLSQGKK